MSRVRYSAQAFNDLQGIHDRIALRDPEGAAAVTRRLVAAIDDLAEFSLGRPGRLPHTCEKVVKRLPYLLVYEEVNGDTVNIIHIRHTSRVPLADRSLRPPLVALRDVCGRQLPQWPLAFQGWRGTFMSCTKDDQMADTPMKVTLPANTSRALQTLAESLGRTPDELAGAAVDRFIADEQAVIAKIEAAVASADAGHVVPWEEAVEGFRATIERAARRRA